MSYSYFSSTRHTYDIIFTGFFNLVAYYFIKYCCGIKQKKDRDLCQVQM